MGSPAIRQEAQIRRLAVMDWGYVPMGEILKSLNIHHRTLADYRAHPIYKDQIDQLREAWQEQIKRIPGAAHLKKKIEHGMALSLDALIVILRKGADKDKIAAARLMAQLDGRFLGAETSDGEKSDRNVESLAAELLGAVNRARVQ